MQSANIMKCIYIEAKGEKPILKEMPIPQISSGQVLIRVEFAPINPSDINFMKGFYPCQKTFPCVPGFEGSGTIVLSGGGVTGWGMAGKRVAFYTEHQFGSYAEYCVAEATFCIELDQETTLQQAACAFVNPLTVIAMLEICKSQNVLAVIHNPGSSQLGLMMNRYFAQNNVKVINIVRSEQQREILVKEGSDLIINSNADDFLEKLAFMANAIQAKIYFDAVAGDLTGQILAAMPRGSTTYVYGRLSQKASGQISQNDLIYQQKSIQGFWFPQWIKDKNLISQTFLLKKLKSLLQTQLFTKIHAQIKLEQFQEGIEEYSCNMSKGKILFSMRQSVIQDMMLKKENIQDIQIENKYVTNTQPQNEDINKINMEDDQQQE